ncbi:MAG TPA: DNRLRE domain-containing protein [Acidimicrobiales bacterium]|nr:DNRLRE domain-containing protein [Acidimicrobiales bacterium]
MSGEKPESKLWWNDGSWWASMWDAAAGGYKIHRLNVGTQAWGNTGTALDPRNNSRADVLWHQPSGKLYVASHVYSESGGSGQARLYRFSYNAGTDAYALDAGFPAQINNVRSESLVIDRDSTGQLWATWTQGSQVWVNRTLCSPTCNDAVWGTPFVPAVNATFPNSTSVNSDDISSLISFGNNRIGLLWGNQSHDAWYFSVHTDSAPDTTWVASRQVFAGPDEADDHLNVATLLAADDGRIFVAVKTSHNSSNEPAIKVLERVPGTGSWLSHTVSTGQYGQTRPIVLIDESAGALHVFSSDEGGGGIYRKSAPLSNVGFTDGKGTLVMWDESSQEINDPTSTKQNLNSTTGLVVLGSNTTTDRYWHHYDPLGGTPPPPVAPVADFSATPTSGTAPLTVTFTDLSTNTPTGWAWDFDSNGSVDSTARNPVHAYSAPGSYTVTLTATNAAGGDSETKTAFITVTTGGGGGGTQTFSAVADAKVSSSSPNNNYGTTTDLRIRNSGATNNYNSYLRFDLSGLGSSISSATLRLWVTSGTSSGGSAYVVGNGWTETGITWANAPAITGAGLDPKGTVATGTWVEWDVTSAVTGNGMLNLAIRNSGGSGTYSSREGPNANDPQLVVVSGS